MKKSQLLSLLLALALLFSNIVFLMPTASALDASAEEELYEKYGISVQTLFEKHPECLNNETLSNYIHNTFISEYTAILSDLDNKTGIAAYISGLKNGAKIIGREILSLTGITKSNQEKVLYDTVFAFMQKAMANESLVAEVSAKIEKNFSGFGTIDSLSGLAESKIVEKLKKACVHIPEDDIEDLFDSLTKEGNDLIKKGKISVEVLQLVLAAFQLQEFNLEMIERLFLMVPYEGCLYEGLVMLQMEMKQSPFDYIVDTFFTDMAIGFLDDAIGKVGGTIFSGGATIAADLLIGFFTDVIYQGPTGEDIAQANYFSACATEMKQLMNEYQNKFIRKKLQNKEVTDQDIQDYEFIVTLYYIAERLTYEYTMKLAEEDWKKDAAKKNLEYFDDVVTYEKYIGLCLKNAKEKANQNLSSNTASSNKDVTTQYSINDDSVFLKQSTGNTCTLVSAIMMFRRGALINNNTNWNSFTETTYKSKWWGNGLSFQISAEGMAANCYKLEDELNLSFGDVENKKSWFIQALNDHPEGIVIYLYHKGDSSVPPHAILLTDYDKNTDTFYCADPANYNHNKTQKIASGRIPLEDSSLIDYANAVAAKRSFSQGNLSDQDFIIGCVISVWMIYKGIDYTDYKTQYRYYHYTNGTKYSVCAYYGKSNYGGTWTREDTGWLDAPLTMVSKSATSYVHTNTGAACTKAGCTDPSWEGGKYEDANGIPWYREETRTVTEEATPHQHEYDKGKITEKASCTNTGIKLYTCTTCGETKSKTIAKTNHTYNSGTVTKVATCGDAGVKTYTCTDCGATKTETISKTGGHTYNDGKVTKAAGCTTAGTMTYTCTVCGKTKTETIAKLGHNYDNGTITKEPTCERTGTRTYTCTSCNATKTEPIEKASHNYVVITEEIAPTCAEKGKTATEKCTICGATQGGKSIARLKHAYSTEWTIDEAPTCVKKGSKSHHCTMCDATDGSVSIAKTEHTYGEWKVITPPQPGKKGKQSRTCSVCGDVETNTLSALEEQSNNRIVMTIDSTEATVFGKAAKTDVAPIIVNNRTMLSVRFVAENLGATVAWDGATRKATIRGNGVTIELYIDSTTAYVNGKVITLDSPAFIQNNRTYMPVRFIAENLGATVEWDSANRQAIITKN